VARDRVWNRTAGARARAALAACGLLIAATVAAATADSTKPAPPRGGYSIKDSPGYYPPADPESASVVLGRRTNAPRVQKPFQGGARSLDELGAIICGIFERTPTLDSLMMLTVTMDEFRDIMWLEFPQSRPATGLTWEDGWRVLYPRLLNGCNSALIEHSGGYYDFVRFEIDSVGKYKNFRLHSRITMVVRNAAGEELRMNWIRAVAERNGRFKIYSVRD
jgi:hypothetical protein